jgi:hypothetical protein
MRCFGIRQTRLCCSYGLQARSRSAFMTGVHAPIRQSLARFCTMSTAMSYHG